MFRILFGIFIFLVASSAWIYLLLFGGLSGSSTKDAEIEQFKQDLIVARQAVVKKDEKIGELEDEIVASRSKLEFLEEGIAKAEGARDDATKDKDLINDQLKELRGELADVENRLLEETNRANALETMNEDIAARLDSSIKEVRRLQTIIRTLSQK